MWGITGFAGTKDIKNVLKKIKSNKDLTLGFKKFIDTPDNNKRNNWRLTRQKEIFKSEPETIKHILQIVKKSFLKILWVSPLLPFNA